MLRLLAVRISAMTRCSPPPPTELLSAAAGAAAAASAVASLHQRAGTMTRCPPPAKLLAAAFLHQRAGNVAVKPSDNPCLQTDGVVAEGRHLRRLGVGGIGAANMAAVDPALAVGAPSVPFRAVVRDAPITDQQKMSTEQDVIAAAEGSPTSAELMPQRTP